MNLLKGLGTAGGCKWEGSTELCAFCIQAQVDEGETCMQDVIK